MDIVRDYDFSLRMLEDAYERSTPLTNIVNQKVNAVSSMYLNQYLPNVVYEALCQIPTSDGLEYYSAPKGFLKNTVVDKFMLKASAVSTTRNHYKAVANATTGVSVNKMAA